MADDDPDDRLLVVRAIEACGLECELESVEDGEQLLCRLRGEGAFADRPPQLPGLVLLDLNMPRMDGIAALRAIRSDARLRLLPVVVFTTSTAPIDVRVCYELGANSYFTKPASFEGMVKLVRLLGDYWLHAVTPPPDARSP